MSSSPDSTHPVDDIRDEPPRTPHEQVMRARQATACKDASYYFFDYELDGPWPLPGAGDQMTRKRIGCDVPPVVQ